jgi:hypothetical protein
MREHPSCAECLVLLFISFGEIIVRMRTRLVVLDPTTRYEGSGNGLQAQAGKESWVSLVMHHRRILAGQNDG